MTNLSHPWELIGYLGNAIFSTRFLVQWIASEKKKQMVIPVAFWWISIAGSIVMAIYFIGLGSIPGILGSLPNSIVYLRNLQILKKQKLAAALAAAVPDAKTEPIPVPPSTPPVCPGGE